MKNQPLLWISWFEISILILLLVQWAVLSFAPIRFDTKRVLLSNLGDYLLFFINIVYMQVPFFYKYI